MTHHVGCDNPVAAMFLILYVPKKIRAKLPAHAYWTDSWRPKLLDSKPACRWCNMVPHTEVKTLGFIHAGAATHAYACLGACNGHACWYNPSC